MLALDVLDVLAIGISLNEEEALTVLRITVPIKVQATRLRITCLGVPVDLVEEGFCVFRLYVEFYVNQNHEFHRTYMYFCALRCSAKAWFGQILTVIAGTTQIAFSNSSQILYCVRILFRKAPTLL